MLRFMGKGSLSRALWVNGVVNEASPRLGCLPMIMTSELRVYRHANPLIFTHCCLPCFDH